MVVVLLVAASRESVSEGGQLASSKYVLSSGDILVFAILFCSSASMSPSLAIILPRYVNYFTGFSVVSSTLMSSSMVVVEFGWNITSVFFMLILRPNFDDALANASTILWISSAEWAISALSSAKSSSLTSIFVFFLRSEVCNCKEVCILA